MRSINSSGVRCSSSPALPFVLRPLHPHPPRWLGGKDAQRGGLIVGITLALTSHFFKHAIDYANVKVHVFVQAGAEAVDEGDCANVANSLVTW
jgi:hypothetical protein